MTEALFIKTISGLKPCGDDGKEIFDKWKLGDQIMVTVKKPRNPQHHAKFFALLNLTLENQSQFPSLEALRTAVIIDCGWFDVIELLDGNKHLKPRSISFASMNQDQFNELYNHAVDSCLKLLPQTTSEEIEREVNSF